LHAVPRAVLPFASAIAAPCAFLPGYAITRPGGVQRLLADPLVERRIPIATVPGRQFTPAVATFVRAAKGYRWVN